MKLTKKEIIKLKFEKFLLKYGHLYDKEALEYIRKKFLEIYRYRSA